MKARAASLGTPRRAASSIALRMMVTHVVAVASERAGSKITSCSTVTPKAERGQATHCYGVEERTRAPTGLDDADVLLFAASTVAQVPIGSCGIARMRRAF